MAGPPTAQAQAQAQASSDTNVDGSAPVPSLSTAASDDAILAALTGASARPGAGHRGSRKNAADGDDIDDDDDDDDGGLSDTSSRSDKSEEAAGLVSRMSDEQDRAGRRAKYEGPGRGATRAHLYSDDEDDEEDDIDVEHGAGPLFDPDAGQDQTVDDESSSISEVRDGVFRVRDGARPGSGGSGVHAPAEGQRRRERGPPNGSAATRTSASLGFRRRARPALARRVWIIAREALPTLLLSLISLVFSGELLIHLARWPVFSKVDKLFILIPILLNLKGNLEGNLSLRMSTSANIGELDVRRTRETLIFGNLALLQVQALIVSLFAGVLSFVLGLGSSPAPSSSASDKDSSAQVLSRRLIWPAKILSRRSNHAHPDIAPRRVIHHHPKIDPTLKLRNTYFEFVLVIATATLSASLSSAILGSFMCALVVVTRRHGGNPDNIASPLAGSLGDLLTLTILGLLSSFLVRFEGTILATLILAGLTGACILFFVAAYRNAYVRELLSSGWIPLLIAMFISSGAGLVLDSFVQRFEGYALLAPVVTGLPGACAAIFVSRTSTALHAGVSPKAISYDSRGTPLRSWSSPDAQPWYHRYITRWIKGMSGPLEGWLIPFVLWAIGVSIVLAFLGMVRLTGQMTFGVPFFLAFALVAAVGVAGGLLLSHALSLALWQGDYDPDIYCLPFVTSIIDVFGQMLLVTAYFVAIAFGDTITAAVNDGNK